MNNYFNNTLVAVFLGITLTSYGITDKVVSEPDCTVKVSQEQEELCKKSNPGQMVLEECSLGQIKPNLTLGDDWQKKVSSSVVNYLIEYFT